MKKTSFFLLLASAIAMPALAQTSPFYMGANIGQSKSHISDVAPYNLDKDSDTAFKLYGGYQFSEYWAIEAGVTDFGKAKASGTSGGVSGTLEAKARALYLAAVCTIPVADAFSLFGKLGAGYTHGTGTETVTVGGSAISTRNTENKSNLMFGLGAQYRFTPQISAVVEYEDFGKVADNWKVKTLTAGVRYAF